MKQVVYIITQNVRNVFVEGPINASIPQTFVYE